MATMAVAGTELSRERCLSLLRSTRLGRVVYTVDALPAVTPVCYAVREGDLLVRAGARSRLARTVPGSVVALQADRIDEGHGLGWSVVVTGVAVEVDGADLPPGNRSSLGGWGPDLGSRYLSIVPTVVAGSSVFAVAAVDGQDPAHAWSVPGDFD